jgi:phage-related protein
MIEPPVLKPIVWIGSSDDDLCAMPEEVRSHMGYALFIAQQGGRHRDAKPLKGFGGSAVMEIVSNFGGDTFRAIYATRLIDAVYVLHAFQKKAKKGRETPRTDIQLIKTRLRDAERVSRGRSS